MARENSLCTNTEGPGQDSRASLVPSRATQIAAGGNRPQPYGLRPYLATFGEEYVIPGPRRHYENLARAWLTR